MTHHLQHVHRNPDGNGYVIRSESHEQPITLAQLRAPSLYWEVATNIFGQVEPMPSQESWQRLLIAAGLL